MIRLLPRLRRPTEPPRQRVEPTVTWPQRAPMRVSISALAASLSKPAPPEPKINPFQMPRYPKGVLPNGRTELAMDENTTQIVASAWDFGAALHGLWAEGIGFMGYPYLAELSQRAEYRRASEVIAEEMTRKWIKLRATGDDDKADKIKVLGDRLEQFHVRDVFREVLEFDGFFGLGFVYLDFGDADTDELRTPLVASPEKIGHHRLKAIRAVDPTWTAPNRYDARDPTSPTFYRPQSWFMMGREIHTTRLLSVVSRPLPDILKPAYNFGGLSLSQLMKPYVDNWLRTRQSVSDLINAFTVFNLSTNLEGLLTGAGGEAENQRLEIMTNIRSNRGMLVTDKATEELKNISAPLGTLDKLQAQSQEQICSVIAVPLVKYLGVTPSGLNASADGEIRVFYDGIKARQEKVCTDKVRTILQILQLDEWSEVDPEIDFEWVPLWELDEASAATVRKTNADTDAVLVEVGAIDPDEVRQRIAAEPESPYAGLDLSKPAPGPPAAAGMEGEMPPEGGQDIDPATSHAIFTALRDHGVADPTAEALLEALQLGGAGEDVEQALLAALRSGDDAGVGKALIAALGGTDSVFLEALKANDDQPFQKTLMGAFAQDAAEFKESDHPRGQPGNAGQFGPGGGGKGAGKKKAGGEGKEQAGQKGAEGAPAAGEAAKKSPASSLMPNPKRYSEAEARELGAKIAASVGATQAVSEARRKVLAMNGAQSIDPVEKDGHIDAAGEFTPERAALHDKLLNDIFTPEAIERALPRKGEKPVVVVLGGRGGSGKSWLTDTEKGGPVDKSKFILIDADHFKGELPEYQGWNAAQLHEESDLLVRRAEDRARNLGLNIVHDATLKSAKSINERVDRYAKDGYDIHGHYMHLSPEMATERATKRFARGQEKTGKGRFVPPEIILGNTDNEKNFDALIPLFKEWSVFDNSGDAPRFVDGSRDYGGAKGQGRKD